MGSIERCISSERAIKTLEAAVDKFPTELQLSLGHDGGVLHACDSLTVGSGSGCGIGGSGCCKPYTLIRKHPPNSPSQNLFAAFIGHSGG
jgi:hypothetical protein